MSRIGMLRSGVLAVALIGSAAWVAAQDPDTQDVQEAATVQIRLTPTGIQVTPQLVIIRRGQELVWNSDQPFALAVERNAELFGRELPPQALRGRANAPVQARTGAEAPEGSYKYSVAVWDGENVWVVDPEIVIRP
jgi:hypothetical protein